jgi:hypothetical protein
MKKLTDEEFSNMLVRSNRKSSPFYIAISGLRIGESLFISKKEWTGKKPPTRICRYIEKKFPVKYEGGRLTDGSGWAMKRVK